jgi:hypothetical protein
MIPPPMQASKWLSIQALLSPDEMGRLIEELGEFQIYPTTPEPQPCIQKKRFLQFYTAYCLDLQNGQLPDASHYRSLFSTFWSADEEAVVKIPVGENTLCRAVHPVIQLQYHVMGYSPMDKKFRPMVMGQDSMAWGIQFSFPQLFQDPATKKIHKVDQTFANTSLFQTLRRWMRENTVPTPFIVDGNAVNVPIRIGRDARLWVNQHPQLKRLSIRVREESCESN